MLQLAPHNNGRIADGASSSPLSPNQLSGVLSDLQEIVHELFTPTERTPEGITPLVALRLRCIALGILDLSIVLREEELCRACDHAVVKLRPAFPHITSEQDWDDARQETWFCLRKQMLNLSGNAIEDLNEYARRVMRNLLTAWRRKAARKKSLSAVPGGAESLAIEPDERFNMEEFLAYLDMQLQPNPDLPMSEVFRAFDSECCTRAKVANKLGVSETGLEKQLKAIRAYREQWER